MENKSLLTKLYKRHSHRLILYKTELIMKLIKRTLYLLLINFTLIFSQVLNVTVSIEYGRLSNDEKNELDGFAEKIEQYFNNYDWVDDEYETDISCNVIC